MKNFNKGAEWRKWDLHIHSPYTFMNKYTATDEDFIEKIESENISLVGLTNYFKFSEEEYALVNKLRAKGIQTFLNLELRLDYQNNEDDCLDLHVVFSEEASESEIKKLLDNLNVNVGATKKKSADLISNDDFKKAVIQFDHLKEQLEDESLNLRGKYMIGFLSRGKGNGRTSTNYEQLALQCSLLIHSSNNPLNIVKDREFWLKHKMPLFQNSDAHSIAMIGCKYTWVKADLTFEGLKQVTNEPKERVFVGEIPSILEKVKLNRTKYIKELEIDSIDGYDGKHGEWFSKIKIPINKELSVVIGNKGSGKSAVADVVALCSGYSRHDDFSFLKKNKFRDGKHADNFEGMITWESGAKSDAKNLSSTDIELIDKVKYLPQGQFEKLTNEIENTKEFQQEIEKVVFDHIDTSDRFDKKSFVELLNYHKENVEIEINSLKNEITEINKTIVELEKKEYPLYKSELEAKKKQKEDELAALIEPKVVLDPNIDPLKKEKAAKQLRVVEKVKKEIEDLQIKESDNITKKQTLLIDLKYLNDSLESIKLKTEEFRSFLGPIDLKFNDFGLDILNVIKINTDYSTIETLITLKETQLDKLKKELGEGELTDAEKANSILNKLSLLEVSLIAEKEKLDSEQQVYQKYILEKAAFDLSKKNIIGDKLTSNTIEYFKEQIRYVDEDLESDLELAYNSRIEKIKLIFKKKFAVIEIYKEIKSKMDETIKENGDLLKEYPISIDASLVLNVRFINNFLGYINKAKLGTFKGSVEGENQLEKIISEINFNSEEDLISFVNEIFDTFKFDKRSEGDPTARKYIVDQVSDVIGLYEYISSLDYNYKLRQADKDLDQLSPGERGALLLVFYLLLDKNDCPLIIDQPEDNLDNHSVANILVPFIKRAKKRRQIIMVTHNPNLAVVADAEQVISVSLDKKNNNKFSFISGSIENKEINDSIVNILEGAMPAFTNRRNKYFQAR
ncbi:TrlF family AAA-like ATPase [uncultured Formosa sp.]|uniref:TrlF family AAA-like ATPase n=1 Tax=uncultured Formosa sp. TaxID=255435 RepID=UPI00261653E0|nr:AAA family ATPase [uncultured Formosa sp.]